MGRLLKSQLVIAVMLAHLTAGPAQAQTPKDLLEAYQQSLNRFDSVALQARVNITESCNLKGFTPFEGGTQEVWIYQDGKRFDVTVSRPEAKHATRGTQFDHKRYVVNEKGAFAYMRENSDVTTTTHAFFAEEGKDDSLGIAAARAQAASVNVALGYLAGDPVKAVDLLLDSPDLTGLEGESVEGHLCRVVRGDTPYGEITLWLDPSASHLPRKAVLQKGRDDIAWRSQLIRNIPKQNIRGLAEEELVGINYTMDNIQIEARDSGFLITAVSATTEQLYTGDVTWTIEEKASISKTEFNPDFESFGAFAPDLQNGQRVHIRGSNDTRKYVWEDGGLVLAEAAEVKAQIPDAATNNADETPFFTSKEEVPSTTEAEKPDNSVTTFALVAVFLASIVIAIIKFR